MNKPSGEVMTKMNKREKLLVVMLVAFSGESEVKVGK